MYFPAYCLVDDSFMESTQAEAWPELRFIVTEAVSDKGWPVVRVMGTREAIVDFLGGEEFAIDIYENALTIAENAILVEALIAVQEHADEPIQYMGSTPPDEATIALLREERKLDLWDAYDAILEGVRDGSTLRTCTR